MLDDVITLRSTRSRLSTRSNKGGNTGLEDISMHNISHPTLSDFQVQTSTQVPSQPEVAKKIYLKALFGGTMMMIFIIFALFSVFWGALFRIPVGTHKLKGWVVDFDQGVIGDYVTSAVQQLPASKLTMTWVIKNASEFPGGPDELAARVHDQKVWFAVSVNPGSSDRLAAAISTPEQHRNYDGSLAVTGYGEEGRNENGFRSVIRPQFDVLMQPIVTRFASQFVAQNISALPQAQASEILSRVPQLVNRPIYYTLNNMRPFDVSIGLAITFVGLIFVTILAFLFVLIAGGGSQEAGYTQNLSVAQLFGLRMVTHTTIYFFLSLFYCLVSLAFQAPFSRFLGRGGFVVYWMLHWVGMLALGIPLEVMMTLMTMKFVPAFLILWILADVAVAFFPLEILPNIFRFGYAMPFYNISQGVRVIVFGTKNHLGLYFGVLIVWTAIAIASLPLAIMLVRWAQARSQAKAMANQLPKENDMESRQVKHLGSH